MYEWFITIFIVVWILGLVISIPFSKKGFKRDLRWADGNRNLILRRRIEWTIVALFWPVIIAGLSLVVVVEWMDRQH